MHQVHAWRHIFDRVCDEHGIEHRFTKPAYPWTNGQVERMNLTLKEATVQRYHYQTTTELNEHLQTFLLAYNHAKQLKRLRGLTPHEYVCVQWQKNPTIFTREPPPHHGTIHVAYQGLRAKDKSFNAKLNTDFVTGLPLVSAVTADLGRVLLNIVGNAFYAVRQRRQLGEPGYEPTVSVSTKQLDGQVEIRVQDNGMGIPPELQDKIFQHFFTTKPAGEGTGLGLSLSYDIVTKSHGDTLAVESRPGLGTAFIITLPASSSSV